MFEIADLMVNKSCVTVCWSDTTEWVKFHRDGRIEISPSYRPVDLLTEAQRVFNEEKEAGNLWQCNRDPEPEDPDD